MYRSYITQRHRHNHSTSRQLLIRTIQYVLNLCVYIHMWVNVQRCLLQLHSNAAICNKFSWKFITICIKLNGLLLNMHLKFQKITNIPHCNLIASCSKLQSHDIVIPFEVAINTIVICIKNAMVHIAFSIQITIDMYCNSNRNCNGGDCIFDINCNEFLKASHKNK